MRFIAVLLIGCLLSPDINLLPQPANENLVFNGDFESSELSPVKIPAPWLMWGAGEKQPENFTYDKKNPYAGKQSFRIYHPADQDTYIIYQRERAFKIEKNIVYRVSFWARTDLPGVSYFRLQKLKNIDPVENSAAKAKANIFTCDHDWKKIEFFLKEGLDFTTTSEQYIAPSFIATYEKIEKTLWIDDLIISREGLLKDEDAVQKFDSEKPYLTQHMLEKGDTLNFTVDTLKTPGPANNKIAGVSFHLLTSGPSRIPYGENGAYNLPAELEKAIADLHLPMTRIYALNAAKYEQPLQYDLTGGIDRFNELLEKCGIPRESAILEFEIQKNVPLAGPDKWARGVRHSIDKGYKFHFWEVGNEPYVIDSRASFPSADDYIAYFIEISKTIRKNDPQAKVGIAINYQDQKPEWREYVLQKAAGYYDFVAPHHYNFGKVYEKSFSDIVLAENFHQLDLILKINAMIQKYNPGRTVYQYDSEWGLHSHPEPGKNLRNGNIYGTLHRIVRMIYCAQGGFLEGAASWVMFGRKPEDMGFGLLPEYDISKRTMLYWTYYYINRHICDDLVTLHGTTPYYEGEAEDLSRYSGPLAPALVTISKDKKTLCIAIANGSWDKDIPCVINLPDFAVRETTAVLLSSSDPDAHPVLDKNEDFIRQVNLKPENGRINFTMPRHAALFITLHR